MPSGKPGNMKILITGATGFLGSHVLKMILNAYPAAEIVLLKRSFSDISRIAKLLSNPRITHFNTDQVELSKIFQENQIDVILHMATEYGRTGTNSKSLLESNLYFPISLLESGILSKTSVFINTDSYFSKTDRPLDDYMRNYILSKKMFREWLFHHSKKIKVCNLFLEHIYGENDSPTKFVDAMITKIAVEKKSSIDLTAGQQKKDFIYIEDVVNAFNLVLSYALANDFEYKTFEIGTGQSVSLEEFVEKIKEISGSSSHFNFGVIPYNNFELMNSVADNASLRELGWLPKFSIDQGISRLIANRTKNE